jgi:hypothetical protein
MAPTKADYAKINIACKELGIDKHQLISDRYKVESSKELSTWQLADLYKHFKGLGWKVKRLKQPTDKGTNSPYYQDAKMRKIVAMWITLHAAGATRSGTDAALQAYVKRMTGVTNLRWCDGAQCFKVIESLKQWGVRKDVDFEV